MDKARIAGIVIAGIGALADVVVVVRLTFFDDYYHPWSGRDEDTAFLIPLTWIIIGLLMVFWPRRKPRKVMGPQRPPMG